MIRHFARPHSVDEALELHFRHGKKACWMGGWSLAGRSDEERLFECAIALDAIRIAGKSLVGVEAQDDVTRIGALTSLQYIMDHEDLPPALRAAAGFQPSRALRCMGTMGGDIAARQAGGCLAVPLTALGAVLDLAGAAAISVNQYTAVDNRDLILFARVPRSRRCSVARRARNARGPVLLTAAVGWDADGGNVVVAVAGPGLPLRRLGAVETLIAQGASESAVEQATLQALTPRADWLGSAAYKTHLAAVTVADCVDACRQGRILAC